MQLDSYFTRNNTTLSYDQIVKTYLENVIEKKNVHICVIIESLEITKKKRGEKKRERENEPCHYWFIQITDCL